jgi:hypothetical protein
MVLVRTLLGGAELAVVAQAISADPLLPGHVRLDEVEGVEDVAFPGLVVRSLVVPRSAILWYAEVDRKTSG